MRFRVGRSTALTTCRVIFFLVVPQSDRVVLSRNGSASEDPQVSPTPRLESQFLNANFSLFSRQAASRPSGFCVSRIECDDRIELSHVTHAKVFLAPILVRRVFISEYRAPRTEELVSPSTVISGNHCDNASKMLTHMRRRVSTSCCRDTLATHITAIRIHLFGVPFAHVPVVRDILVIAVYTHDTRGGYNKVRVIQADF